MAEVMKHNTPSNSHSVENSEQEKTKILVWAEPSGINSPLPGREGGRLYRLMQFHLVDLESDKLHFDCIPSLLQCAPPSSVLAVDNSVYIFGTRFIPAYDSEYESDSDSDDIESGNKELQSFMSLPHDKAFLGASRYDLSSDKSHQTNGWCRAPIATRKRTRPLCVSLDGKIYVFGSNYFQPEVLDPTVGHSTALDLPCELVGCKMSKYPLPDPSNRRILVHLFDGQLPSPSIYEFRLNDASCGGNWRRIAVDFHDWTKVAAVVDNAIYFYDHHFPNFIRAYDLASGTWLKICWKSKLKKIHGMNMYMQFDAMISLGNRILCFVVWLHVPEKKVRLHFFKFRVEQSGATVNLFPLKSYSYDLPNTCEVQEFLPLQQEGFCDCNRGEIMAEVMKHNTSSNSRRVKKHKKKEKEKEKTRILVPIEESGPDYALPGKQGGSLFSRMHFHLVDLENDKVQFDYTPSLLKCTPLSSMLAVDNSFYIFGCRPYIREYESESESETQEVDVYESLPHDELFLGASRYDWCSDKSHQNNVWCPAPVPTRKPFLPDCVSLDGKIYVFGSNYLEPEVLDPIVGQSKSLDLPCHLVGCKMSDYPVLDPSNRRILVHVSNGQLPSPSIYELRLDDDSSGGNWNAIAVDFHGWTNVAAVVDNVIYFYKPKLPNFIRAFDLATGAWLEICWKSKFKKILGVKNMDTDMVFDAMISLGNRILCFIVWLRIPEKRVTNWVRLHLLKFRVQQIGATVNLCPIRSYSYDLPDTWRVQRFLPL